MPVERIDHVNIRTPDLAGTIAFFRDVLEMEPTPAPGASIEHACWMRDAGGQPAVHLGRSQLTYPTDHWIGPNPPDEIGTGRLHHAALNCSGHSEVKARLERFGLDFSESDIPQMGLRQIFVREPNGILLELNFWES